MPEPRDPTPTYGAIARAVGRSIRRKQRRGHGPLGIAIPGTDLGPRQGWRGRVERRDPKTYQGQVSVGIVRCPTCQHWRDENPAVVCSTCGIYSIPL